MQHPHTTVNGGVRKDYIPHHQRFSSTLRPATRPHHLRPTSVAMIGRQETRGFTNTTFPTSGYAANAGNLPAVSFIKAPPYQDGNAGYSNPLVDQQFAADFINRLQALRQWRETAVIIAWDKQIRFLSSELLGTDSAREMARKASEFGCDGLAGFMDGSVSTSAPVFAAGATKN